jgi:hypothetical protein
MNKKEIMWETFNAINKAVTVYKCKRNQDLGLRNASVEKKLDAAMQALGKQFVKVVFKEK